MEREYQLSKRDNIHAFRPNGDRYEGLFYNGKKAGQGKMMYANGIVREGYWVNNQLEENMCAI